MLGAAAEGAVMPASAPLDGAEEPSVPLADTSWSSFPVQQLPKAHKVNGVTYAQLSVVGRGGSSKVYSVRAPSGEVLALKRVTTDDPARLDALAKEVTLLNQLQNNRHVIRVYDAEVNREKGQIVIVMELGEMDLGQLLQSKQDLGIGDVQQLWRQMLEAVHSVHEERIVHLDIKPGNFMFVGGRLKIIDFGLANRIPDLATHITRDQFFGTINYMPPESLTQGTQKLGRASDVWALGIILYQMIYRRAPWWRLENTQKLFAIVDTAYEIEFPADHRFEGHSETVKRALRDVLQACLKRVPKERLTIPQLLEHSFLVCSSLTISRNGFDRIMQQFAASLLAAAQGALRPADVALQEQCDDRWCTLFDEVWSKLQAEAEVAGGAGQVGLRRKAEEKDIPRFNGLEPFREHLTRLGPSPAKKPRTAAPTCPPKPPVSSAPAPPLLPLALGARGKDKPVGGGLKAAPQIRADLLQMQKDGLRKVFRKSLAGARADGEKENDPRLAADCRWNDLRPTASSKCAADTSAENVVIRRLRDRRLAVTTEAEDEPTECMQWLNS